MSIAQIRALCDAATPGPWHLAAPSNGCLEEDSNIEAGSADVAADVEDRNAAFIAAARTLLPLLLDVAETAHAYLSLPPSIPHNAHHERARALGIALASLISATPPDA